MARPISQNPADTVIRFRVTAAQAFAIKAACEVGESAHQAARRFVLERVLDTPHDAATEILGQMSDDDRAEYLDDPEAFVEGWRDGVSAMLVEAWSHLDLEDVLHAMDEKLQTLGGGR